MGRWIDRKIDGNNFDIYILRVHTFVCIFLIKYFLTLAKQTLFSGTLKGIRPERRIYSITPSDHISQLLPYLKRVGEESNVKAKYFTFRYFHCEFPEIERYPLA